MVHMINRLLALVALVDMAFVLNAETGGSMSLTHPSQTIYKNALRTIGCVISKPGYYIIGEDIEFNASSSVAAITISSSSVTLDMNNRTLSQSNTATGVTAIKIESNVHDITIKNGTIHGFIDGVVHDVSSIGTGAYNVNVDHICINGIQSGRPLYLKSRNESGVDIHDWIFSNCLITQNNVSDSVSYLSYCKNILFTNCEFNNNSALNYVFYADNATIFLKSCQCCKNNNRLPIYLSVCSGCIFQENFISNNSVTGSNLQCITLSNSNGCDIKNCILSDNSSDQSAYGISLAGGGGHVVDSCTVSSIRGGTGGTGFGITLLTNTSKNIVNNCVFQNIAGLNAYCCYLSTPVDCTIQNCQMLSAATVGAGAGYGIYVSSGASKIRLHGNQAYSNSTYGIFNNSSSCLIYGCTAGSNETADFAGSTYPPSTAGFTGNRTQDEHGKGLDYIDGKIYIFEDAVQKASPGLTISDPGYYVLAEDIEFSPSGTIVPAITIASNYVTLDMNDHVIYQNSSDLTANVNGIEIDTDVHDITIKNGKLSGFRGWSLSNDARPGGKGAYNVTIDHLDITRMPTGYAFVLAGRNSTDAAVRNWSFLDCALTENHVSDLIYTTSCNNVNLSNCTASGNVIFSSLFLGRDHGNLIIKDCNFCNNELAASIVLYRSHGCVIDGCVITNNGRKGSMGEVWGCNLEGCSGCIVKNCIISRNFSNDWDIRGIRLKDGTGNIIASCDLNNNTGAYVTRCIAVYDNGAVVRDCSISYVMDSSTTLTDTLETCGIYISGRNNFIENCEITRVSAINTAGPEVSYGLYLETSAQRNVVYKCKSNANSHYGFYDNGTNNAVVGCIAAGNGTTNFGGSLATGVAINRGGSTAYQLIHDEDNRNIS